MNNKQYSLIKIGERIEFLKKEKGITNAYISENLNVSEQAVSKIITKLKNGKNCNLGTIISVFDVLGVDFLKERL
ncbi:helix-turn-helix domain-containing protein [Ilyobacter sp.]|uniref:helix-turn-helix domain-containing protein n=1 Tax=Ilyobacter sp. TaxID=3100343 RepID=UPI0035681E02